MGDKTTKPADPTQATALHIYKDFDGTWRLSNRAGQSVQTVQFWMDRSTKGDGTIIVPIDAAVAATETIRSEVKVLKSLKSALDALRDIAPEAVKSAEAQYQRVLAGAQQT